MKYCIQVTENYHPVAMVMEREERQKYLESSYNFLCSCKACAKDLPTIRCISGSGGKSHSHSSGSFLWRKTWQLKWVDKVASPEQQEMILIGFFLQATEAWAEMLAEAKLLQVEEFSLNLKITWLTCFKSCRPFGLFLYFVQRSVGLKRSWRCASQRFARSIIVFIIWPPTPPEYFIKQNSTSGR